MISPVNWGFLCQATPFFNKRLRQAARGSRFIVCHAAQECKLFRPTDMIHICQEGVESVSWITRAEGKVRTSLLLGERIPRQLAVHPPLYWQKHILAAPG